MANQRLNYSYIASQLSVEEIALEHGYEYVSESTCDSWPVLKGPGGKVVVGTNGFDRDYYFNPLNGADKGNIITFVKNHLHLDYKEMQEFFLKKLGKDIFSDSYHGSVITKREGLKKDFKATQLQPKKIVEPFDITKHNYRPLEQSDSPLLSYFIDTRHLSKDVFFDDRFVESIGVTGFNYGDRTINNISFPLTKVDTKLGKSIIVGLYQNGPRKNKETGKIESFKYFTKGSERGSGLWKTALTRNMLAAKHIPLVVVESPIDAMSLYLLHKEKLANALFVSPIGQISDRQVKEIEAVNMILNHKLGKDLNDHTNVITAMDNDEHGLNFNIKVKTGLGQLKGISSGPSSVSILPSFNSQEVIIEVRYPKGTDSEEAIRPIANLVKGLGIALGPVNDGHDSVTRRISCIKDTHAIEKLDRNLSEVLCIASAYPKTKDWNEDLTRSSLKTQNITQQF